MNNSIRFRSVEELYAAKSAALQSIERQTRNLSTAQATFHAPSGGWSIAEILEHLCIVEDSLLRLINTLLKRTEDAGKTDPLMPSYEGAFQSALEGSQTEKYSTRDKFHPTGNATIADSLARLRGIQSELESLRSRLQSVDLTYATFPHWIFGPLNLGEWLAFVCLHEERHLAQIRSIVSTPGFGENLPLRNTATR